MYRGMYQKNEILLFVKYQQILYLCVVITIGLYVKKQLYPEPMCLFRTSSKKSATCYSVSVIIFQSFKCLLHP